MENSHGINTVFEAALRYRNASISVFPARTDGSKAPAVPEWKSFQSEIPSESRIAEMFAGTEGIAMVTGTVSGGLEVIDFDAPGLIEVWKSNVRDTGAADILDKSVEVQTPSGGAHVIYRCSAGVQCNQKLARRKLPGGSIKTVIETRGEGGYVLAPGSPDSCHQANKPYELIRGSYDNIPDLSAEERALLIDAARALNEF